MPTRQELLASIESKLSEIETARATYITSLEEDLASLRAQVEAEETSCGCSTLTKIEDGKYQCSNADCQKEFEFAR